MNEDRFCASRIIWLHVVGVSQNVQLLSEGNEVVQLAREAHVFVDIYVHADVYQDKIII